MFDSSGSQLGHQSRAQQGLNEAKRENHENHLWQQPRRRWRSRRLLSRDDGPYVGIEGGVTLPQTTDLDVILNNTSVTPNTSVTYSNGDSVKSKTG